MLKKFHEGNRLSVNKVQRKILVSRKPWNWNQTGSVSPYFNSQVIYQL